MAGPTWIDDAGRCARDRLRAGTSEAVIGHCDWLASNLRWNGDKPLVVHDWTRAYDAKYQQPVVKVLTARQLNISRTDLQPLVFVKRPLRADHPFPGRHAIGAEV